MRILVSNDDGILAPGLAALVGAVGDMGEVRVVAPDSPQSASGHSITLAHPLCVRPVQVDGAVVFEGVSVDGRPADCVRLALKKLIDPLPDLVLSGINAGANVGINVFYSGTVAAAAEAVMCGCPAVAFSVSMAGEVDFPRAAALCRAVLDDLLKSPLAAGDLINVNIPALKPGRPKGVRVVPQSTVGLDDAYLDHVDENGRQTYRLADKYGFLDHDGETDVAALMDGYITVTPLHVDMTRHDRLDRLAETRWGKLPE